MERAYVILNKRVKMCSDVIQMTTTLTTRLSSEDKIAFEKFCQTVGMTPSTAINMFVKATLREGQLPFAVKADPFYSEANMTRLRKNAAEMDRTGGTIREVNLDD